MGPKRLIFVAQSHATRSFVIFRSTLASLKKLCQPVATWAPEMHTTGEITQLLVQLSTPGAEQSKILDELMPLVYADLKALAKAKRYRWHGPLDHGTTSLVHEAYSKLAQRKEDQYQNRGQFLSLASRVMRNLLIDNARWYRRQKRGAGLTPVPADEVSLVSAERSDELLALDEALGHLEKAQPDLARIVECRVFGGLTIDETTEALEISAATVKRRWTLAKSWLYRELRPS